MTAPTGIIITGLAGQGVVSLTRFLEGLFVLHRMPFSITDIFGESQRGGPVSTHIRLGPAIHSPVIAEDGAQLIVALETMEGLRVAKDYLAPQGIVLLNNYQHASIEVDAGVARYPPIEEIEQALVRLGGIVHRVEAHAMAKEFGNAILANSIMMGAIAALRVFPFDPATVRRVVEERSPLHARASNLHAFDHAARTITFRAYALH